MSVIINNGWLDAVIGRSIRSNEFIFIPIMGDIDNERIDLRYIGKNPKYISFDLSDYIEDPTPIIQICGHLTPPGTMYAVWVRARMSAIFGYGVPLPELDGLIDQTFAACKLESDGNWMAHIFKCKDEVDDLDPLPISAMLLFAKNRKFISVYEEITKDFCQILLREVDILYPFRSRYHYHDGLEGYIHSIEYSQEYGFYVEETDDDDF